MTAMADRAERTEVEAERVLVPRTAEQVLGVLAMVVSAVFLGGFTLVMNGLDEASFTSSGLADLLGLQEAGAAEAYHVASTLAAWFGFTLVAVLLLAAVGLMATRSRPWRRRTGWWFAAAGVVCLLGSQLIGYPFAFIFFLTAGLFALRPVEPRSTS